MHWCIGFIFHTQVCVINKYRERTIKEKIHRFLSELWPLITVKNGFRAISFQYIGVLDSYFIHRYIIYRESKCEPYVVAGGACIS